MPKSENHTQQEEIIKYLKANLLLQIRSLTGDENEGLKPEVLLHRAGFSHKEISEILGKEYSAVKMTILRAKNKGSKA